MASSYMSSFARTNARDLDKRGIHVEKLFDAPSFKDMPFCNEGLKTILKTDLVALTKLPEPFYPRLVRAFYKNLHTDIEFETGIVNCTIEVDNVEYSFTSKDIALALGIKGYKPIKYDVGDDTMIRVLNKRPSVPNPKNEVRESFLHEDFWLVGKFMKDYMCPFTHDQIIPQYLYKYWHGMYVHKKIDLPTFMLECMMTARDGGRIPKLHGLVLPRTITAILGRLKYKIRSNEEKRIPDEVFNHHKVKKSIYTLATGHHLMEPIMSRRRQAQGRGGRNWDDLIRTQDEEPQDTWNQGEWTQGPWMQGEASMPPQEEIPTQQPYHFESQDPQPFMPSQEQWEAQARAQAQMLALMQGYGTQVGEMHGMMRGMESSMQQNFHQYDSRLQGLETTMGYMQEQLEQNSYETHQALAMQRLSISRSHTEEEANAIFAEAERSNYPRAPRRRQRRRHFLSIEQEEEETME